MRSEHVTYFTSGGIRFSEMSVVQGGGSAIAHKHHFLSIKMNLEKNAPISPCYSPLLDFGHYCRKSALSHVPPPCVCHLYDFPIFAQHCIFDTCVIHHLNICQKPLRTLKWVQFVERQPSSIFAQGKFSFGQRKVGLLSGGS